jgi:DNA polymerase-4
MTLAKIGSDFQKPRGLTVILPGTEAEFLAAMPVRKMSGIGPKSEAALREVEVRTLGELSRLDPKTAQRIFGKNAEMMLQRASGIDERPVVVDEPVKSVSNEYTFSVDIRTKEEVRNALNDISAQVGRRLRQKGLKGKTISLKLRFSDFRTRTVSKTLDSPTDNDRVFGPLVFEMAQTIWSEGAGVRLLGVGVSHFGAASEQLGLFDVEDGTAEEAARSEKLVGRLDDIKDKFGETSVISGRELKQQDEDAPWHARHETGGHNAHD